MHGSECAQLADDRARQGIAAVQLACQLARTDRLKLRHLLGLVSVCTGCRHLTYAEQRHELIHGLGAAYAHRELLPRER